MRVSTVLDGRVELAYGIVILQHAKADQLRQRAMLGTVTIIDDLIKALEQEWRSYRYVEMSDLQQSVRRPADGSQ